MSTAHRLISIITPCLNRAAFVREAVESVLKQNYPHVEHIVVDGGSTDGTLDILAEYPHLRVVSEPDNGLYDALNKAVGMAQGQVVGLLNTDDLYPPDVFGKMAGRFGDPDVDVASGGCRVFEERNGAFRTVAEYVTDRQVVLSPRNLTVGVPIINARFFRRELFRRVGGFDTRYRIAADRDFLIRVALSGAREARVDGIVYYYRQHAGSLSINRAVSARERVLGEHLAMARHYRNAEGVPEAFRNACRAWYSHETAQEVKMALGRFALGRAARFAAQGARSDPRWPLVFAACLVPGRVRRRVGR